VVRSRIAVSATVFATAIGIEPPAFAEIRTIVMDQDRFGGIVIKLRVGMGNGTGFCELCIKPLAIGLHFDAIKSVKRV
jgi:hypothetical protein